MKLPSRTLAVVVALSAGLATACTGGDRKPSPTPEQPSQTAIPTPSRTPSPTPTSDEDRATQKVIEAIKLNDELNQRMPGRKMDDLATVARGELLKEWRRNAIDYYEQELVQQGYTIVIPASSTDSGGGIFKVKVCEDVSQSPAVDKQGKNARPTTATLSMRRATVYEVTKAPQGFFLTNQQDGGAC